MNKRFSIFQFPFSNSRGFTLIEFLTVTVVLASIGIVIMGILSSALRTTNKTNIVNSARVNGNQAINQITRMVEYARSFEGVSNSCTDQDYSTTCSYSTNCAQPSVGALTPTPTPVNTHYRYLKIIAIDGGQVVFSCVASPAPTPQYIASNNVPLIDTNTVSVVPGNCWFTCNQDRVTSNPIIGVSFQLQQTSASGFVENTASVPFETSVTFRNLVK